MDPEHTLHFATNLAIALSNKMYSSYSNQRLNSNVLRLTPPGFKHPIDVQFPPRCLPVCGRCKKNFKTRESAVVAIVTLISLGVIPMFVYLLINRALMVMGSIRRPIYCQGDSPGWFHIQGR
jgi:hypothetical protein